MVVLCESVNEKHKQTPHRSQQKYTTLHTDVQASAMFTHSHKDNMFVVCVILCLHLVSVEHPGYKHHQNPTEEVS